MEKHATTGQMIKALRREQKLSQEALALKADSSSRYISFIETGRAHPSRSLLLRLARELNVDGQITNDLLISADYSPIQPNSATTQQQQEVLSTLRKLITTHPYPAIITNRHGKILAYNTIMKGTIEALLGSSNMLNEDSANIHLLELSPQFCRPYILNLTQQENNRLNFFRQECLRHPDDETFQQLYQQLKQFKDDNPSASSEAPEQHYFSQLQLQKSTIQISFYWFYSAIGCTSNQLSNDLQVLSALPANNHTEQWFQQFS